MSKRQEIQVPMSEFKDFVFSQPDDRKIEMGQSRPYIHTKGNFCGCVFIHFLWNKYPNAAEPEACSGSVWGRGTPILEMPVYYTVFTSLDVGPPAENYSQAKRMLEAYLISNP